MNFIKCPKCGKEEPAFDYAHVCGPIQVKKSFNKLLREFEKESKLEIFGLGARRDVWEKALEKYAELIVKECVQACINEGKTYAVESAGEYQSNLYANAIKQHFGVGE